MLAPLYEVITDITFTTFAFPRAADAQQLYQTATFPAKSYEKSWMKAVESHWPNSGDNSLLIITGSLYFISAVRNHLMTVKNKQNDPI
jgi:dihydrofolate synthase/folylpolyglutamate synthase